MKTSIKIITGALLLFCIACGAKRSTPSKMNKNQQEMAAEDTNDATTATVTDKTNNSQMYLELQMTTDQIQRFENTMEDFTTRHQNTASGEMMGTVSDESDRQLENILSEEQYSAYETWKKDN